MTPVNVIKIHHEGAGAPTDNVMRFAGGGYTVGLGRTLYRLFRRPDQDWSTFNLNHVVMGVCFSGQRQDGIPDSPAWDVTDQELTLLRLACNEARQLGWIIPGPIPVSPHDHLAGSATVCPGTRVYNRWARVVAACQPQPWPTPPVPPVPTPKRAKMFFFFTVPDAGTPEGRKDVYVSDGIVYNRTTPPQLAALQFQARLQGISVNIGTMTKAQLGNMQRVGP